MKWLLLAVALELLGCGSRGLCDGSGVGLWTGTTVADHVVLSPSCGLIYTGPDGCNGQGTYSAALQGRGQVEISITSATAGACMRPGTYFCDYTLGASSLSYDCGAGTFSYRR